MSRTTLGVISLVVCVAAVAAFVDRGNDTVTTPSAASSAEASQVLTPDRCHAFGRGVPRGRRADSRPAADGLAAGAETAEGSGLRSILKRPVGKVPYTATHREAGRIRAESHLAVRPWNGRIRPPLCVSRRRSHRDHVPAIAPLIPPSGTAGTTANPNWRRRKDPRREPVPSRCHRGESGLLRASRPRPTRRPRLHPGPPKPWWPASHPRCQSRPRARRRSLWARKRPLS